MPSSHEHRIAGALTGCAVLSAIELLRQCRQVKNPGLHGFDWRGISGKAILGFVAGACAGALPDLLEPADNPFHRKFCHSSIAGAGLLYALFRMINANVSPVAKQLTTSAIAGSFPPLA